MPSFHSGEVLSRRARVQSQVERSEPKGNLDGFLARLQHGRKTKAGVRTGVLSTDPIVRTPDGNLVLVARKR